MRVKTGSCPYSRAKVERIYIFGNLFSPIVVIKGEGYIDAIGLEAQIWQAGKDNR